MKYQFPTLSREARTQRATETRANNEAIILRVNRLSRILRGWAYQRSQNQMTKLHKQDRPFSIEKHAKQSK